MYVGNHVKYPLLLSDFKGVLISPYPDLLPEVFCLMLRIFRLMLVLFYTRVYIYIYIYIYI